MLNTGLLKTIQLSLLPRAPAKVFLQKDHPIVVKMSMWLLCTEICILLQLSGIKRILQEW